MLKKVETKCKRCKSEFCKKRTEQEFFQRNAGTRRGKSLEKIASRVPHGEALLMALFLQLEQTPAKHRLPLIWGLLSERKS